MSIEKEPKQESVDKTCYNCKVSQECLDGSIDCDNLSGFIPKEGVAIKDPLPANQGSVIDILEIVRNDGLSDYEGYTVELTLEKAEKAILKIIADRIRNMVEPSKGLPDGDPCYSCETPCDEETVAYCRCDGKHMRYTKIGTYLNKIAGKIEKGEKMP